MAETRAAGVRRTLRTRGAPPTLRGRRLSTLLVVVSAVVALLAATVVLSGSGGAGMVRWVADLAQFVVAALAAASAGLAARRATGRGRAAWTGLGIGLAGWAAGQAVWSVYELGFHRAMPFPSIADAGYLLLPVGAAAGLWLLPAPIDRRSRWRGLIDGVVVVCSLLSLSWVTTLSTVAGTAQDGGLGFAVSMAYPVGDVVVLSMALLTLTRYAAHWRVLTILVAGLAAMAVADSAFAYLTAIGRYATGSATDLFWMCGFVLVGLSAAAASGTAAPAALQAPRRLTASAPMLPYLPLVLACAVAVLGQVLGHRAEPVADVVLVVAVAAVLLRQYLTLRDNVALLETVAAREAQLQQQAFHDGLTGLANRALFADRVAHALTLHAATLRPLAVLVVDLDDFKVVNDTLGHATGDALLVRVAERFRGALRPGDTLARFGGDEFAVLVQDTDDAATVAARLLDSLRTPFVVADRVLSVRASIGFADLAAADEPPSPDQLFVRADLAMYTAKRAGKGRIAVYRPDMVLPESADLELRPALLRALAEGRIEAWFQPIVDIRDGRVRAVEALARWRHEGRWISPEVFVGLAARSGVLDRLTDHMLDRACAQLADWSRRLGDHQLQASVNVPPLMLKDPGFPGRVRDALHRYGVSGHRLVLEITEDALIDDVRAVLPVIAALRDLGAELALDDFGTGYSSLLSLRQIALHSVKIDLAFVANIDRDPEALRFLRALLALGNDLRLRMTAEGVERPEQAELLRAHGCHLAQGFLYARAMPAAQMEALLAPSPVALAG
ncbi:putative bifunctional diguanylate cyclase/phosphodiesterase [Nakamurella endophytica]|uniref:GGDEF-domain containing protein n=1 Tax=Nakamurella endophytica TaxID=1748367 RepID=A0A917WFS9_9ACTN|nr:bifunctional diguanylate cyclase/phosphodiesterase [Nakamurella endophytica]GGL99999.1 GGDEF-domain containing protein [Nakamurella endophytica]